MFYFMLSQYSFLKTYFELLETHTELLGKFELIGNVLQAHICDFFSMNIKIIKRKLCF